MSAGDPSGSTTVIFRRGLTGGRSGLSAYPIDDVAAARPQRASLETARAEATQSSDSGHLASTSGAQRECCTPCGPAAQPRHAPDRLRGPARMGKKWEILSPGFGYKGRSVGGQP